MKKLGTTLIKDGTVVLRQTVSQQDVLIRGEHIVALGNLSDLKADVELDPEGLMVEDTDLKQILEYLRKAGSILMVHAEDNEISAISSLASPANLSTFFDKKNLFNL